MTTQRTDITKEHCERWRTQTMRKSLDTAERLTNLLRQKNGTLSKMARNRDSAIDLRERKLRNFMKLLTRTLETIGTDGFGKCSECNADLSIPEINAMPWASRCRKCPETHGFNREL